MKHLTPITGLALVLVLCVTLTSCDFLQVEPTGTIVAGQEGQGAGSYTALLAAAYDDLQDFTYYGQYFMLYPAAMADNARDLGSARYDVVATYSFGVHMVRWAEFYNSINTLNRIIDTGGNIDASQAVKQRLKGAALFLRALNYFDLMRTHSYEPGVVVRSPHEMGVILRTNPVTRIDEVGFKGRAPIEEVYQQMEADLKEAISLLDDTDPILNPSEPQFQANKAAAQALLAQVYLYWKKYERTAQMADAALQTANSTGLARLVQPDEYVQAFAGATNPEWIFAVSLDPRFDGDVTFSNESLSALTTPSSFNFTLVPTFDLLEAYSEGDVRLEIMATTSDGITYIRKYTQSVGAYTDHIPVLRYAEVLLMRAESRAESGNLAGALKDLNRLREARGLEPVTLTTQDALIAAIMKQRRLELAFEGERFFDLKRRGLPIPKPQRPPAGRDFVPYDAFRILAMLPENEVEQNPKLKQNPGY